jgi:MFS family permease
MKRTTQPIISPRRVLTVLGIGTAVSMLGDATLYTVLPNPTIANQVGVSLGMVGVLLGANRAIRLLINSPMGMLYDRMPRRGLMVASLILGTLANFSYALGSGFWPILAGRITWGIAWATLYLGGNAVVLDISDEKNRGRYSGRYQMWLLFGIAFSSFTGGLLTDLLGFRGAMWLTTGVIGAAALLWMFALPETRRTTDQDFIPKPAATSKPNFPWKFIFQAAVPVFFTRFIAWGVLAATMILWLSGFIEEGIQLGELQLPLATVTGSVTAITMLFSMGVAPTAGRLSDKLGRRWGVMAASILVGAAGIWLMSGQVIGWAMLGIFLAQITGGTVETLVPAITGDRVDKAARGRTLGMVSTFGDLGSTLGPAATLGILNAEVLTLAQIYQLSAAVLLLVAVFAWLQRRRA